MNKSGLTKRRREWSAALATLVAAVIPFLIVPAINEAHLASEYYGFFWTTGSQDGIATDQSAEWRFTDNFPSGQGLQNRVKNGAMAWNELPPDMSFPESNGTVNGLNWDVQCPFPPTQSAYQDNRVGWQSIPGNEALAQAQYCGINETTLLNFRIRFDRDRNWYGGTDTPAPSEYDMWSVAGHEFGHAGGRAKGGDGDGHFLQTSPLCPDVDSQHFDERHTMCPSTPRGTRVQRSLEEHDRDVFRNAY